jgi:hypothetical protein
MVNLELHVYFFEGKNNATLTHGQGEVVYFLYFMGYI